MGSFFGFDPSPVLKKKAGARFAARSKGPERSWKYERCSPSALAPRRFWPSIGCLVRWCQATRLHAVGMLIVCHDMPWESNIFIMGVHQSLWKKLKKYEKWNPPCIGIESEFLPWHSHPGHKKALRSIVKPPSQKPSPVLRYAAGLSLPWVFGCFRGGYGSLFKTHWESQNLAYVMSMKPSDFGHIMPAFRPTHPILRFPILSISTNPSFQTKPELPSPGCSCSRCFKFSRHSLVDWPRRSWEEIRKIL